MPLMTRLIRTYLPLTAWVTQACKVQLPYSLTPSPWPLPAESTAASCQGAGASSGSFQAGAQLVAWLWAGPEVTEGKGITEQDSMQESFQFPSWRVRLRCFHFTGGEGSKPMEDRRQKHEYCFSLISPKINPKRSP